MSDDWRWHSDERLLEIGAKIEEKREQAIRDGKPDQIRIYSRKIDEYLEEIGRRA